MAKKLCSVCDKQIKLTTTRFTTKDKKIICQSCTENLGFDIMTVSKNTFSDLLSKPKETKTNLNALGIDKSIKCPNCKSKNVSFMQNNRKKFSVGKAIGGAALTGGVGTLAGFVGKKGKNQWHCQDCSSTFATK